MYEKKGLLASGAWPELYAAPAGRIGPKYLPALLPKLRDFQVSD